MSMRSTEEWAQHAILNMTQAQRAQCEAGAQCDVSRRAQEGTVAINLNMYEQLHAAMGQKVQNSYRLVEKLQKRAGSLELSLQQTKASLALLEKTLQEKEGPLQLCTWRLEQREKRPLREQVRDSVEVALEEEKATLIDVQKKLGDGIRKTKQMISDLQACLDHVRQDLEQKMHALSLDEMCMRTTKRSMHATVEMTPPPPSSRSMRSPSALKPTSFHTALQESSKNEVARQQEAERLNRTCAAREEAGRALRDDNTKLAQRSDAAAADAVAKSEKRIQDRVNENQQMRRRLEGQIRETIGKIEHTKATLNETRFQLEALKEPMHMTASCASWRKQRAAPEHIVDPVATTLQEHRMTVMQAHQDLTGHHENEKGHLRELLTRHNQLRDDLRDKTAALHIDLNCLTHDAARTSPSSGSSGVVTARSPAALSQQKLVRAMLVDRAFVPGTIPATAR